MQLIAINRLTALINIILNVQICFKPLSSNQKIIGQMLVYPDYCFYFPGVT